MENLLTNSKSANSNNEIPLYKAKIHWISYVIPVIFIIVGIPGLFYLIIAPLNTGIIALISICLCVLFFKGFTKILKNKTTKIDVNYLRLTISTGIFSKNINDLSLRRYEGISLSQNFLGRILKYGTLIVSTGEIAQSFLIENPIGLRQAIIEQTDKI